MIILGLDPGSRRVGYGLIQSEYGVLSYLKAGILSITSAKASQALIELEHELTNLIQEFKPTRAVIERLYMTKNQKTAIAVAEARGILVLLCAKHDVEIQECTPSQLKYGITGYGGADKQGVARLVRATLRIDSDKKLIDDATDALALAIIGSASRFS